MSQQTSLIFFHGRKVHLVSMKQLRVTWICPFCFWQSFHMWTCAMYSLVRRTTSFTAPIACYFYHPRREEETNMLFFHFAWRKVGFPSWQLELELLCCNVRAVFPFFDKRSKLNFQSVLTLWKACQEDVFPFPEIEIHHPVHSWGLARPSTLSFTARYKNKTK